MLVGNVFWFFVALGVSNALRFVCLVTPVKLDFGCYRCWAVELSLGFGLCLFFNEFSFDKKIRIGAKERRE